MPYPSITKKQIHISVSQGFFLTELGKKIPIESGGFHVNHYKDLIEWLNDYNKEQIPCRICGKSCNNLGNHVKTHGLNSNEYRILFNIPTDHSLRSKDLDIQSSERFKELHKKGLIPYGRNYIITRNFEEKAGYMLFRRTNSNSKKVTTIIPEGMFTYRIQPNGETKYFTKQECIDFLSLLKDNTLAQICSNTDYPTESIMKRLILTDIAYVVIFNVSNIHRQLLDYIQGETDRPPGLSKLKPLIDDFLFDNIERYDRDVNKLVNGIVRRFYLDGIKKISLSEFKNKILKDFKT